MPTSVDQLQIELNANATKANDAIDRLVLKLDRLSTSLGRINGSAIIGLANGVDKLGRAMQIMSTVKTSDFSRLTSNIEKLSKIDNVSLNTTTSSLSNVTREFNRLGTVSQSAQQVGVLAESLTKLGYKGVTKAIQNIPQLANSLNYLLKVLSKAPVVSTNVIQLTSALANLSAQGQKVGTASKSITNGLNTTSKSIVNTTKKTRGLASAFGSLYANFFWVKNLMMALWGSIETTADYIESFNYYTVAFEKIASEWDENWEDYGSENAQRYSNSFVKQMNESFSKMSGLQIELSDDLESGILTETGMQNLGLNLQEITQYASQLASITNSVGQTGDVSLMAADAFTKLAGDMSSLFNIDYSTVAQNLQSGLIGQSRALYKYGIDITNATLQTYAYQLGVSKAVSEMTQAEKMQLRMIAILDQSKVAWGDLADTINTPANMIRQLSNNFKEASMVLGQLFMPLLTKVLPFINGVIIAIKNLFVTIAGFMGIEISLDSIGIGVSEVTDEVDDMTDSLDDASGSAKQLRNQLQGFDKLNVLTTPSSSGGMSGAIGGVLDLTEQIKKATEEYQKAWEEAFKNMESKAQVFAENVEKALQPIADIFQDFAVGDFFKAGEDVSKLVISIGEFLDKAIKSVDWESVGKKIGEFLKGMDWAGIIKTGFELTFDLGKAIADVWFGSFNTAPIETALMTALGTVAFTGVGAKLAEKIASSIAVGFGAKTVTDTLIEAIKASFNSPAAKSALVFMFNDLLKGLKIAVPITVSLLLLKFEWDKGKEREELEKFIDEYGEEVGRVLAGTDWMDKIAVYEHDVQNANDNITQSYLDMFDTWGEKIQTHQTNVEKSNDAINKAYLDMFSKMKTDISNWWDKDVAPWFTAEKWQELFADAQSGLQSKWNEFVSWWETTGVHDWWIDSVAPWFTKKKWTNLADGIKSGISAKWDEVVSWWDGKQELKNINVGFTDFLSDIKSAWEKVKEWWDGLSLPTFKFSFKLPKLTITFDASDSWAKLWKTLGYEGTPKFGLEWKQYENGGFPEDGWFRASKGEYFGSFDDGTSVIANNNQIISGIANGVKSANAEQNALLREQNALLRQILAKDTGISTRDIFDAVRSENRDYINRNGESAFAY